MSFLNCITSQISVPEVTLSSCFCPPEGFISTSAFLSLLDRMLNVDLLLWVCFNKNVPTTSLWEYFRLPEETVSSFFLCVLFSCTVHFAVGHSLVYIVSFSSFSTCILTNDGVRNPKQLDFLHSMFQRSFEPNVCWKLSSAFRNCIHEFTVLNSGLCILPGQWFFPLFYFVYYPGSHLSVFYSTAHPKSQVIVEHSNTSSLKKADKLFVKSVTFKNLL